MLNGQPIDPDGAEARVLHERSVPQAQIEQALWADIRELANLAQQRGCAPLQLLAEAGDKLGYRR